MSNEKTNALAVQEPQQTALQPSSADAQASSMARARVEAQYLVAQRFKRSPDDVRLAVIHECKRPRFAAKAMYSLPIGGERITGPSIRLAETLFRLCGNMEAKVATLYDDDEKQLLEVSAVDYETNASHTTQLTVEKTVERKSLKAGQVPIGSRINSYGARVYLVTATERDFTAKRNAQISKAMRNVILRLVPEYIIEEAMEQAVETMNDAAAADPDAERKKLVGSFATIGVRAADLRDYLGHDLSGASPAELADLRAIFQTVKDGAATWRECLAAKTGIDSDRKSDPMAAVKAKVAAAAAKQTKRKRKAAPKPTPAEAYNGPPEDYKPADQQREPGQEG